VARTRHLAAHCSRYTQPNKGADLPERRRSQASGVGWPQSRARLHLHTDPEAGHPIHVPTPYLLSRDQPSSTRPLDSTQVSLAKYGQESAVPQGCVSRYRERHVTCQDVEGRERTWLQQLHSHCQHSVPLGQCNCKGPEDLRPARSVFAAFDSTVPDRDHRDLTLESLS
jgi:hypothetical protein